MNWSNSWDPKPQSNPSSPLSMWDAKSQDEVLLEWDRLKKLQASAKEAELEFRKYIVKRAFPVAKEGMNNLDLGNGYTLKAGVKFNYKLAENDKVEAALEKICKVGNQGQFIADRLVSWTPNFLLTEYRQLQEEAGKGSVEATEILKLITDMLTIDDAAPTLEIKEPKVKK